MTKIWNNVRVNSLNHMLMYQTKLSTRSWSDCEIENISINETSDTQEVNADHKKYSFKNSTSTTLNDNESDTKDNIFEKLFKADDVSSIIIYGEQLQSFQSFQLLRMKTKNLSQTNWFTKQWQSLIWLRNY